MQGKDGALVSRDRNLDLLTYIDMREREERPAALLDCQGYMFLKHGLGFGTTEIYIKRNMLVGVLTQLPNGQLKLTRPLEHVLKLIASQQPQAELFDSAATSGSQPARDADTKDGRKSSRRRKSTPTRQPQAEL